MFTQCPECRTVFRVNADMLKVAQGRVRCGRCSEVFNARTFLVDAEDDTEDTSEAAPSDSGSEPASAPAEDELPFDPASFESGDIPESALEFTAEDLNKVFVVQPAPKIPAVPSADSQPPAVTDEDTAEHEILDIELETPGSPEVITLEGDSVILGEEDPSVGTEYFLDEESGEDPAGAQPPRQRSRVSEPPTPRPVQKTSGKDAIDDEVQREIEAAFAGDPTTRAEFTLPSGKRIEIGGSVQAEEETDAGEELELAELRRRRLARAWSIGSGVLAFTLLLQLVHHNRESLARNALLGPMITRAYAGIGSELSPDWNVRAYEVRQFGATADALTGGTLRVRASVLNGARHAQPYPLLRLTLQDRFGGQVGLRDLEPREYLRAPPKGPLIGAGQRVDADIAIVDPGRDAASFEIDVCLRAAAERITCANDAARNSG